MDNIKISKIISIIILSLFVLMLLYQIFTGINILPVLIVYILLLVSLNVTLSLNPMGGIDTFVVIKTPGFVNKIKTVRKHSKTVV
jgi:hypothetical protein